MDQCDVHPPANLLRRRGGRLRLADDPLVRVVQDDPVRPRCLAVARDGDDEVELNTARVLRERVLVGRELAVGRFDDLLMHVDHVPDASHDARALTDRVAPGAVDDGVHRIDVGQLVGRAPPEAAADDENADGRIALGLTHQREHHLAMRSELFR